MQVLHRVATDLAVLAQAAAVHGVPGVEFCPRSALKHRVAAIT